MIDPLRAPPVRKTVHGATMSPRMSRLYTWIQANGVHLNDWSTDDTVQREMHKLLQLRDALSALIARDDDDARDVGLAGASMYLVHLAADLAALMRRVPSARVTR